MQITSVNNDLVKETAKLQQKKYRTQSGKFLLEGFKSIKEAFDYGIKIEKVFVDKKHVANYTFFDGDIIETTEAVLKKLSSTESAPEAVAVGFQKIYDKSVFKNAQKVVLLENIKDLGNLGTIIRSSVAFNVDVIVLYGGQSVDIYNPKSVRASVGNLWKIPIVEIKEFNDLKEIFGTFNRVATLPRTKNLLKNYKINLPALIMFGSEADGLSQELTEYSTDTVKIEMSKAVESLNLASSVSIILYELFME